MSKQVKKRARVTGITLDVVLPDGNSRTITVDPNEVEALFWSEQSVLKVLGPYYDTNPSDIDTADLEKRYGQKAKQLAAGAKKVKVTKKKVEELWNTPDDDDFLVACMGKTKLCKIW